MKNSFFYLGFGLVCLALISCSDYQKILKSVDYEKKYLFAKKYYNEGKHLRAQPLFDELLTAYRGSDKAEDIYYYYIYNEFNLKNYPIAGFHFKNFSTSFPNSSRLEETEYMHAYCLSLESPVFSLDQTATKKGIEAYQVFINKFPKSARVDEANKAIDRLRGKLQQKALASANMYFKMEDYRAAAISFQNVLREFPDLSNREDIEFLVVKSFYFFAEKSLDLKKTERYGKAAEYAQDYLDDFPKGVYVKDVNRFLADSKLKVSILKSKNLNTQ